jgi:predicted permease
MRRSAAAIGATAVAIGVTMTAFAVVNGAVLKSLGIRDLDRIVNVAVSTNGEAAPHIGFTPSRFARLQERAPRSLNGWVGVAGDQTNLSTDEVSEPVLVEEVSGPYFDLLHVQPLLGRLLNAGDSEGDSGCCAAVISERLWRGIFGSDPGAISAVVHVMSQPFVVVGVAPANFRGVRLPELLSADVWIPMKAVSQGPFAMQVFAGLKPGTSFASARSEVRTLGRDFDPSQPGIGIDLLPAWRGMVPEPLIAIGLAVAVASIVVCGAILLLAGTTAVNLSRARFLSRRREFAVRLALGAEKSHLTKQAVADALAITLPAAVAGSGLAAVLLRLAQSRELLPASGAFVTSINSAPDLRVWGFVLAAAAGLTVLLARAEVEAMWMDPAALGGSGLNTNGVSVGESSRMQLGTWQLGVATTLLILTGLFLRSSASRVERDAAFPSAQAVLGRVQVVNASRDAAATSRLVARLLEDPAPDGARLAIATALPLPRSTGIQRAGVTYGANAGTTGLTQVIGVSAGFLDVLGVPLVSGAGLPLKPDAHSNRALVDATLASTLWPAGEAVGRRLWLSGSDQPLEVVGVVKSPTTGAGPQDLRRFVFVSLETQVLTSFEVLLKGPGSEAALTNRLRQMVASADSSTTLIDAGPLRNYSDPYTRVAEAAFGPTMIAAGLAIVMTIAGLYAVVNHNVVSRSHEFGIRNALGAPRASVYAMVIRECLTVVARGTAIGAMMAAFVSLLLPTQMVLALRAADFVALSSIPAGAFVVAILAMLPAARRATRSDPIVAMRAL